MKITVWQGAFDGENGTETAAFRTEREVEDWVLEQVESTREEFEASGEDDLNEFIGKQAGHLDTWTWSASTIELTMADLGFPAPEPIDVAVILDGGLVQYAVGRNAGAVNLYVVDYDVEGAARRELTEVPQDDGKICDAAVRPEAIADGAAEDFWTAIGANGEAPASGTCGQCEGTGTVQGGLGGDGADESCPVCDGSGKLKERKDS